MFKKIPDNDDILLIENKVKHDPFNNDPEEIEFCKKKKLSIIFSECKFARFRGVATKIAYLRVRDALKNKKLDANRMRNCRRMFDDTDDTFKTVDDIDYEKIYIEPRVTWKEFYTNVLKITAEKYDNPAEIYYYVAHVLGLDVSDKQQPPITKKMLEAQDSSVAQELAGLVVKALKIIDGVSRYKYLYRKRFADKIEDYQSMVKPQKIDKSYDQKNFVL